MQKSTYRLTFAALCLAAGLALPFLTFQNPALGSRLLLMHIPVLLCGLIAGGRTGAMLGFILPLLRSLLFGMPPLFPTALTMAFELAAYGLVSGLLYRPGRDKRQRLLIALPVAMVCGRIVWGLAAAVFYKAAGMPFGWEIFMAGAFINALPGIIIQLALLPPLVILLGKAGVTGSAK
ncbi:MAG TPA: ECF transporter S component [Clostridiales bacterium]|nr:ECF transporter S component [Clostridiales bacterium]